mgnify:FL=1
MNNEKICPVYSASDNTARKCIKEECGWGCDQCNACAVVSASDSDIYVLYYTPGAESVEELTFMYNEAKKAVAPRPIIALPTSLSLKEISKQELLNIISKTLCKDKADHDDRGE